MKHTRAGAVTEAMAVRAGVVLLKIAIGRRAGGPLRRGIERDFARMLDKDPMEIGLRLGLTEEEMALLCLRVIRARVIS